MEDRQICCGDLYRHFKGMLYQVVGVAIHSETREEMVVYQALYGEYLLFVRPLTMFLSEIDHEKYPEVKCKYRFTKIDRTSLASNQNSNHNQNSDRDGESVCEHNLEMMQQNDINRRNDVVNEDLMSFLDAKDYGEKLEVLYIIRKKIDDKMMGDIEMSLDLPVMNGTIEERIHRIRNNLQTMAKYEGLRLR